MLRRLETIENLAVAGETAHMQHMDHAKRVRQLAHHLRAVLLLSEAHHYPSALVVVRSALEHHLMDRLIFLANRYIVTYTGVKRKDVPSWDVKLAAAQAGDQPDIATWFWDQSGMNVVHRGFHSGRSKKGRGQTISSYYFQVEDFDPFAGPKKHAGRLAAPFWERKHTQQWAEESASAWRYLFRHDAVIKMARRDPPLVLHDWDDVLMEVREAQLASSYFWFLSGEPEMFDRIDTVHTPPGNWKPKWGRPKVDPSAIRPVRVRYYRNPLRRVVKLHQSYREMSTGLVYRSPFERQDARSR